MLSKLFDTFNSTRVVVIGDVMLDECVRGNVERISPEAPVPIVDVFQRDFALGGAGNVATNIANLGGNVGLIGVVGADTQGTQILELCHQTPLISPSLLTCHNCVTTTKTRIIARGQQMLRIDREKRQSISAEIEAKILDCFGERIVNSHACVLSDYAKGLLTHKLTRSVIATCRQLSIPIIVDPKGCDFSKYYGATVVTPNLDEAKQAARIGNETARLEEIASYLQATVQSDALLITQGAQGMSLFRDGSTPILIPAEARYVYDVTGAGDTVVAVLALAIASGTDIEIASRLANHAAGLVVEKIGTASVTLEEMMTDLVDMRCWATEN